MRSYKCLIKRNLLTQSYITNDVIDAIRQESYEIPFNDYQVLENFPQEYVVDSNSIADPVGVMGTNVEGEFLDVIAKTNLRNNIDMVFNTAGISIVEGLISPIQLGNNVLTDAEKRSGCALVDLGADTTTLVVYKNNIVRYLVTIPLGSNNINKDLATLPIDDAETEDVKLKYGDACQDFDASDDNTETQYYTTSDGRQIDVATIKNVIEARMTEIIANVNEQIVNSDYSEKLLAGLVITGGGSGMKNIVRAFVKNTNIEKVRVAAKVNQTVVKTSNAPSIALDSPRATTIVSLLLAGTEPCGGESFDRMPDIFDQQQKESAARAAKEAAEKAAAAEAEDAIAFDKVKAEIRAAYDKVKKQDAELKKFGRDKRVRQRAKEMSLTILDETIGERYEKAVAALQGKDKFKQSLKEGADLAEKLKQAVDELTDDWNIVSKENSVWGILKNKINELVNDDEQ
jgi:cell division protein FtsA